MKRSKQIYRPAVTCTPEQLLAAEIADLETDVRCAIRDNQPEYADECRSKIHTLRGEQLAPTDFGFVFGPEPAR